MESRWHGAALVALVMVGAMLAGCNEAPPEMLDQAEAEDSARRAPALLARALDDPAAAGLAASEGAIKVQVPSPSPTPQARDITYRITWGRDDTVRLVFLVSDSNAEGAEAAPQPFTVHCLPDMDLIGNSTDAAQVRKPDGPDDLCLKGGWPSVLTSDEITEALARPPDLDALAFVSATPTRDGGARAAYQEPGRNYTAAVDAKGRITSLAYKSDVPENRGTYRFQYGSPERLDPPEAKRRVPVEAVFNATFNGRDPGAGGYRGCSTEEGAVGRLNVTVHDVYPVVSRGEVELRMWDEQFSSVLASFPLSQDDGQVDGFAYTYTDADDDGRFSPGDIVHVSREGWKCDIQYQFTLWDSWAEMYLRGARPPASA